MAESSYSAYDRSTLGKFIQNNRESIYQMLSEPYCLDDRLKDIDPYRILDNKLQFGGYILSYTPKDVDQAQMIVMFTDVIYLKQADLHLWIASKYRHTRQLKAFIRDCLNFAFVGLELNVLKGFVPAVNQRCLQFAKHIGFETIGMLANENSFDGKVCNTIIIQLKKEQCKYSWKS